MEEIAAGVFVETEFEGVNVGAIVTDEGIICIDAPSFPRDAREWAIRLERLNPRPIRYLIVTDSNGDRLLNTRWINAPIIVHDSVAERIFSYDRRYPQSMIDDLNWRNPNYGKEFTNNPVDRPAFSFNKKISLVTGEWQFTLTHVSGPTAGSIWIDLPQVSVLFTGDSVVTEGQPYLKEVHWQDWLESLERLTDESDRPSVIVPGRGLVSDIKSVYEMIDYLYHLRAALDRHLDAGGSRADLNLVVDQLFNEKIIGGNIPGEWIRYQLKYGLERIYDETTSKSMIGLLGLQGKSYRAD